MADLERTGDEWLDPGVVRTRLLEELRRLPRDEHLEALAAVDRRDVEIVLTDQATITVIVAERWQLSTPAGDVIAADAAADADG